MKKFFFQLGIFVAAEAACIGTIIYCNKKLTKISEDIMHKIRDDYDYVNIKYDILMLSYVTDRTEEYEKYIGEIKMIKDKITELLEKVYISKQLTVEELAGYCDMITEYKIRFDFISKYCLKKKEETNSEETVEETVTEAI